MHGPPVGVRRDPRHLSVSFAGVAAEALMLRLDLDGVSVGVVAGCMAEAGRVSPVLRAMGVAAEVAGGAVLLAPAPSLTVEDVAVAVERIAAGVARLRAW